MSDLHQGGCQCGALRYQFRAALRDIAHCHCSICRRSTGGTLVTWITVPLAAFAWLRGEPARFASSPTCERYFCPNCGAHLALFTTLSPSSLDVTIATLDHPEHAAADRHIWTQSRLPWLEVDPSLPQEQQERID
ncbi:GFA family protein [Pseudomonas sp. G34]|uniref:GFA family protein n=1 Tax=Pseudomonas sp. G34 TaxID=3059083 RepID=UPI0028078DAB|nr:GFA family protein [Pseudomonas sp. G34]MDQ7983854.1 GFA family protein [Pseudomonas sp. G34]